MFTKYFIIVLDKLHRLEEIGVIKLPDDFDKISHYSFVSFVEYI